MASTRKYNLTKEQTKMLFGIAEDQMAGSYHEIYQKLGWRKHANGNFHCWNESAHTNGIDAKPSFSVDKNNGRWHCFTCGVEGNFQKTWTDQIKGGQWGDHYTDFIIDFLGLQSVTGITTEKISDEAIDNLKELYEAVENKYHKDGKYFSLSDASLKKVSEETTIDISELNQYVDNLLNDQGKLDYIRRERNITPEIIKKYKLGLDDKGAYVFPIIDGSGLLLNMKAYNPTNPNFKWLHKYRGRPVKPTPMDNFTKQTIYFFEGEPDTYCAIGFGIEGAVTMGAAANKDVVKVFGYEIAKMLFTDKEIVICCDSDEEGARAAKAIAKSVYQFAKQVKIVNLNYDKEINPFGLDPEKTKEVVVRTQKKVKRAEKDYTDYMKKNGFGQEAVDKFNKLVTDTPVYTENVSRVKQEEYKVSIQEARNPKYFDYDGNKRLIVSGTISDFDERAYFYDKSFCVSCPMMLCLDVNSAPCLRNHVLMIVIL
jgi:hypothetical protein